MATAKKAIRKSPSGKLKVDPIATVELAVKALENPAVIKTIDRASQAVAGWAASIREHKAEKKAKPAAEVPESDDDKSGMFKPRFGQKGLERRSADLRVAAKNAFPDPSATGRVELETALDEIDRYLAVVAVLPLVKRKQGHWKADDMLDTLERSLVNAIMPKGPAAQSS